MKIKAKNLFLAGLGLVLGLSLVFLFFIPLITTQVAAGVSVGISGCLPNGAEDCNTWDISQCVEGGTEQQTRVCSDGCTSRTETIACGQTCFLPGTKIS